MKEYIEREALLRDIEESVAFTVRPGMPSPEMRGANQVIDRIKAAKPADVVEVVRCKDCKHCLLPSMHCIRTTSANKYPKMAPDDFCSYGERRGDHA